MKEKIVSYLLFGVFAAYGLYESLTYTGIYRFFAEVQLTFFGSYGKNLTIFLEMMVLGGIALAIRGILRRCGLGTAGAAEENPRGLRRQAKQMLWVGLGAVLVASGAALGGQWQFRAPPLTPLDIGAEGAPKSLFVESSGVMHPELAVKLVTTRNGAVERTEYTVPLTAPGWKEGDPIAYFVETGITAFPDGKGGFAFLNPSQTPPAPFVWKNTFSVTKNGLQEAKEVYEKNHVAIATPHYVLRVSQGKGFAAYIPWAWGGAVALIVLGTAGARWGLLRRARAMEEASGA